MKASVIVPNFNGETLLKENLPSVLGMGADEVIVVDDASTDGSVEELKAQSLKLKTTTQKLKLLMNNQNLGFSKSVNRGVEAAHGDVVILLNTDVKPDKDLLKHVIPHFKDKKVFGVSFSEEQWSWSRGVWENGFVEHEPGTKTDSAHSTFWISGGSGTFRKSVWDEMGGFDEIYAPFYWEDVDICYRAAKRGYKLIWEPKARVVHSHEGTIGKYYSRSEINFVQERNQLIFIWKNITSEKMFKEHLMGLGKRLVAHPGYIKIILLALSKWGYILKARAVERKEAKVIDEQIFKWFQ